VDSSSELVNTPEVDFDQEFKMGLWLDARYSERFGLYGRAAYSYKEKRAFFADIENLYAKGRFILGEEAESGLLRYRAGRFRFEDFSGYVLEHNLDGLRLSYEHPRFSLEAGGGYTGLTFVPSSTILLTQSDLLVQADAPESGYGLASPKLIERVGISFPGLLLNQDLVLETIFQQDLQADADLAAENDRLHTEHIGLGLKGSLGGSFYQDLFFYLNLGQGKYTTTAYLFGGGLRYYNRDLLYTRVELRGLYSSGDNEQGSFYGGYAGDGASSHFIGLSSSPESGLVFSPEVGNISITEASFSLRPLANSGIRSLEKFQSVLSTLVFFRNSAGAISEGGINPSSDENYLGTELDLILKLRPFSDLGLALSGGLFFPNDNEGDSAFNEFEESVNTAIRLEVSFSF